MDPAALSIADAGALFRSGELSPVEVVRACLDRVGALDPTVRAFEVVTDELALRTARAAEKKVRDDPEGRRPLLGIPVALKDLVETAGIPTTASSRVLAGNVPERDAPVWRRLRRAGSILVGKTRTHEFAYGSSTPPTRNPWDTERIPGGSSGGSAAALAAGFCLGAIGTDTAGSIRIPSALCGVVGLKPTYGLVPKSGVIPLSWTLDHVGPMARSPRDAAVLLDAIAGHDASDPASAPRRGRGLYAAGAGPRGSLRVGVIAGTGPTTAGVCAGLDAASAALEELGAELDEVVVEGWETAVDADFTILGAEAAVYHEHDLARRPELYTDDVRVRLEWGFTLDAAAFVRAMRAAQRFRDRFDDLLADRDLLLCPGMPCPAPPAGAPAVTIEGRDLPVDRTLCRNTSISNLTGLPALAVPSGFEEGLPVGVQLIGSRWGEGFVLAAGQALSEALSLPSLA